MYRIVKVRFMCFCGILLVILYETHAAHTTESYEPTHVRTWTGWYDTDRPAVGAADDERVTSIRKRGYQICSGHSPIDAICRDVSNHAILFNADTTRVTDDSLVIACTTNGLLCRNVDQQNHTCRNYEIRFECLGAKDGPPPPNLGVIGVAAGLSVVVPIVCVAIMHVARLCRDRRRPGSGNLITENSEQSSQTDISNLPPSYSILFPDSENNDIAGEDNSQRRNNTSVTVSLVAPVVTSSGISNMPNTRLSSGNLSNLSEYQEGANEPLTESNRDQEQHPSFSSAISSTWRSRFPNMHLSVFDLFMTSDCTSRSTSSVPQSPDLSYVQTPPPTYKEAIVILGADAGPSHDKDVPSL